MLGALLGRPALFWEPHLEVGYQMAPKMAPQRKSGPALISQYRA